VAAVPFVVTRIPWLLWLLCPATTPVRAGRVFYFTTEAGSVAPVAATRGAAQACFLGFSFATNRHFVGRKWVAEDRGDY
jgi:hypothetical protein